MELNDRAGTGASTSTTGSPLSGSRKPRMTTQGGTVHQSLDALDRILNMASSDEFTDGIEELRRRWKSSKTEQANWQEDVRQSMARWSLQRARVEEEIVRRQEASRYASPVPRFLTPEQSKERGLFRQGLRGEASRGVSLDPGESSGEESDSSISSRRSLSPYRDKSSIFNGYRPAGQPYWVRSRPYSASAVPDRRATMNEATNLVSAFKRRGIRISEERASRALLIPTDKPYEDCISRLPKPGAYLAARLSVDSSAKNSKGKKSPKKGGKKKASGGKKGGALKNKK